MKIGDLVWMPPAGGAKVSEEVDLVFGLILEEPRRPKHGPLRVRVLWAELDGDTSIDWEPAAWLEVISFV